jgi:hypothetical protein
MVQEGENVGQLSFTLCTFKIFCKEKEKKRKCEESEKNNHSSVQVGGSYQEKPEGKKSKWADKSEKKDWSDKKDCLSPVEKCCLGPVFIGSEK